MQAVCTNVDHARKRSRTRPCVDVSDTFLRFFGLRHLVFVITVFIGPTKLLLLNHSSTPVEESYFYGASALVIDASSSIRLLARGDVVPDAHEPQMASPNYPLHFS